MKIIVRPGRHLRGLAFGPFHFAEHHRESTEFRHVQLSSCGLIDGR
jgi:hypothetical protein